MYLSLRSLQSSFFVDPVSFRLRNLHSADHMIDYRQSDDLTASGEESFIVERKGRINNHFGHVLQISSTEAPNSVPQNQS